MWADLLDYEAGIDFGAFEFWRFAAIENGLVIESEWTRLDVASLDSLDSFRDEAQARQNADRDVQISGNARYPAGVWARWTVQAVRVARVLLQPILGCLLVGKVAAVHVLGRGLGRKRQNGGDEQGRQAKRSTDHGLPHSKPKNSRHHERRCEASC
jgi:hypothetical protein